MTNIPKYISLKYYIYRNLNTLKNFVFVLMFLCIYFYDIKQVNIEILGIKRWKFEISLMILKSSNIRDHNIAI